MKTKYKISIIGDGGWGTTLAVLLSKKGFPVTLWGAFPGYCAQVAKSRMNKKFLPGVALPKEIHITATLTEALVDKNLIVFAVPSQYLRGVLKQVARTGYSRSAVYLSVTKGIEMGTLRRMLEVIHEELGNIPLAVLSGPTIAQELVRGIPTTAVIASHEKAIRCQLQKVFMAAQFRVYTSDDVVGVELGGALKNVIAIACGISDGLGFGTNTKAALLSRGLAEIARLGKKMGAKASTFSGLSGLGDLVTTCISPLSRNRFVGEQIGKGKSVRQVITHMQMVAEGVPTAQSAHALSRKYAVEMPLTREVYSVLYKNKSPRAAVKDLMAREGKEE